MSVREFRDSEGRDWRAWDVAPDELNARIKNEDYLAALNYTGWIVFETRNESEKRRLYPIPKGWSELPDPELEALLERAETPVAQPARITKCSGSGRDFSRSQHVEQRPSQR